MGSGASRERLPEHLKALLSPVVSGVDLDLEQVEVTPAGRRRVLRVVVDCDGGVGLDEVTAASHAISTALDASDVMGTMPYVLEVTSPGVDRPLTSARHWRRAVGRLVRAELVGGAIVLGRVSDADEAGAELEIGGAARRLEYTEMAGARVQVEFSRAAAEDGVAADLSDDDADDDDGEEG